MWYAIYASENRYCGGHGIETYDYVWLNNSAEAESIGVQMSLDLMESYSFLMDELYEDAGLPCYESHYELSDEELENLEELMLENVDYEIYELNIPDDFNIELLKSMDFDAVINTYCNKR